MRAADKNQRKTRTRPAATAAINALCPRENAIDTNDGLVEMTLSGVPIGIQFP